jgi:hypothetical protein
MTISRPVAGRLVGWLVVAALAVFAALFVSTSLAPLGHLIALPKQTHSAPAANSGSNQSQSHRSVQPSGSVQSQSSAGAATRQPDSMAPPTGTTGSGGTGVSRFADAGPDILGAAQPQTVECGPKPCPHLMR